MDLSCWLVQMYSANRSPAFAKDKVYLKNLFHRIRALLALNCTLLFVTGNPILLFYFSFLVFLTLRRQIEFFLFVRWGYTFT